MKSILILIIGALIAGGGTAISENKEAEEQERLYQEQLAIQEQIQEQKEEALIEGEKNLTTMQRIYIEAENCNSLTEVKALLDKYGVQGEYVEDKSDYYRVEDADEWLQITAGDVIYYKFSVPSPAAITSDGIKDYMILGDDDLFHIYRDYSEYDFAYKYEGNSRLEQMIYINDITGLH